jgi:hypothetical protein
MQIISDIVVRDYVHKQSVDIVYGQQVVIQEFNQMFPNVNLVLIDAVKL